MLAYKLKYVDFDEVEKEETFYFNLTKAELLEMEVTDTGSLKDKIEKIIQSKNQKEILNLFKDIVILAYGEKINGKFKKSESIREDFKSTQAYSDIFWELATNEDKAAWFINNIVPKDLKDSTNAIAKPDFK